MKGVIGSLSAETRRCIAAPTRHQTTRISHSDSSPLSLTDTPQASKRQTTGAGAVRESSSACLPHPPALRIMKFVAAVSSSMRRQRVPTSNASMMLAAWLVLPDASGVEKSAVDLP